MESTPSYRPSAIVVFLVFVVGFLVGGWMTRDVRARSFLAVDRCEDKSCLRLSEMTGLAAAYGIQRVPNILPYVVFETNKTIAFRNPAPEAKYHFIIVPKKDIKSSEDLGPEDQAYLVDAYAVINKLIRDNGLKNYLIKTNGPGYQEVGYLHFHLIAES